MNDKFKNKTLLHNLINAGYSVAEIFCFENPNYIGPVFLFKMNYKNTFLYVRVPDIFDINDQINEIYSEIDYALLCAEKDLEDNEVPGSPLDFTAGQLIEKRLMREKKNLIFDYDCLEETSSILLDHLHTKLEILIAIENSDLEKDLEIIHD